MFKKRATSDPGLELIARYQEAIVQARLEHLVIGGHTADVIAEERAAVEALAARICDAMRRDYAERSGRQ